MKSDTFRKYVVEYYFNGSWWGIEIYAESFVDAYARVKQLQYAKVLGTYEGEIPASLGSWPARAYCWLMNLMGQRKAA